MRSHLSNEWDEYDQFILTHHSTVWIWPKIGRISSYLTDTHWFISVRCNFLKQWQKILRDLTDLVWIHSRTMLWINTRLLPPFPYPWMESDFLLPWLLKFYIILLGFDSWHIHWYPDTIKITSCPIITRREKCHQKKKEMANMILIYLGITFF